MSASGCPCLKPTMQKMTRSPIAQRTKKTRHSRSRLVRPESLSGTSATARLQGPQPSYRTGPLDAAAAGAAAAGASSTVGGMTSALFEGLGRRFLRFEPSDGTGSSMPRGCGAARGHRGEGAGGA